MIDKKKHGPVPIGEPTTDELILTLLKRLFGDMGKKREDKPQPIIVNVTVGTDKMTDTIVEAIEGKQGRRTIVPSPG